MIFETHAHYEDERFDEDRQSLLASMRENGIGWIVNVGSTIETSVKSIELAQQYDFIYAAVGVHPSEIACLNDTEMEFLKEQARHEKVVAVGEIGLDYYWEKDPEVRKRQQDWFRKQLVLAKEVQLPVIIHSRDAAQDTLAIMKEAHKMQIPGIIHCFSYSPEIAQEYAAMGYYIGIGGVVTFKNAKKLREVVRQIPLKYLLLETDCPYMAPEPYRGKRNSSLYLSYVVEQIAAIKGCTPDEVIAATKQNACNVYQISQD